MPWRRQPAHSAELLAHWQSLGQALGRDTPAWRKEGRRLLISWARWPRAYHDTTHLRACLRHLQVVQRTIGYKSGTGGSSGVDFLRRALDLTFFPELFEVRTTIGPERGYGEDAAPR